MLGYDNELLPRRRGTITMPKSLLDAANQWNLDSNASVIHYHSKLVADIDTSFERACTSAELEGVFPHTLKHTAITWAFQNGMSIEDASD